MRDLRAVFADLREFRKDLVGLGLIEAAVMYNGDAVAMSLRDTFTEWCLAYVRRRLRFFHDAVHQRIEAMELPAGIEKTLRPVLVPAAYLSRVIGREDDAERRDHLREALGRILAPVRTPDGPFAAHDVEALRRVEQPAFCLADIFQRASSCVEGRNGRLSQWEHAQRRLGPKKLAGITVVHNYVIKRADETTAAERFFGSKPRDLFAWLLEHVRAPPWPGPW